MLFRKLELTPDILLLAFCSNGAVAQRRSFPCCWGVEWGGTEKVLIAEPGFGFRLICATVLLGGGRLSQSSPVRQMRSSNQAGVAISG